MNPIAFSVPLFRLAGIAVRADWTLLLLLVFDALVIMPHHGVLGWAIVAGVSFTSILLHEFGHALAAKALGGDCRLIVMWMFGGLAHTDKPMRPWPHFAGAAAGPLVTAILAGAAWFAREGGRSQGWFVGRDALELTVWYALFFNTRVLIFNLLPINPLDGSHMMRALLWSWLGLRKATMVTLYLAYPALLGVFIYAGYHNDHLLMGVAIWMTFSTVREHVMAQLGQFEEESWARARQPDGWLTRWRRERSRRLEERRAREEQAEQDQVDRLLAKVGDTGLASLTKQERATLEAYSRKQRERQEIGSRR